jgi:hypothetical protein
MKTEKKSKIAAATPFRRHLDKDKSYFYCTCGESQLQVIFIKPAFL